MLDHCQKLKEKRKINANQEKSRFYTETPEKQRLKKQKMRKKLMKK